MRRAYSLTSSSRVAAPQRHSVRYNIVPEHINMLGCGACFGKVCGTCKDIRDQGGTHKHSVAVHVQVNPADGAEADCFGQGDPVVVGPWKQS